MKELLSGKIQGRFGKYVTGVRNETNNFQQYVEYHDALNT